MNSRKLFCVCVVMCITRHSIANTDDEKCTKMEGRSDSQLTGLRKQLLCNYDRNTAPINASSDNRVQVEICLGRYRIDYKSSLEWSRFDTYTIMEDTPNWFTMSAYVFMSWKDERLQWNKSEHNNRSRIVFAKSEIWAPDCEVPCGKVAIFGENDGTMVSLCWSQIKGICKPIFSSWGDQRGCVLFFRVFPTNKIQLSRMREDFSVDYYGSNSASWSVVKAERIFPLKEGQQNTEFLKIHKQIIGKYGPDYFETKVVIQKNFAIQDAVMFAPAAVLLILLISSTWIPAKQEARVALLSMTVIIQVFMFHRACRAMPFFAGKLINIVGLYQDLIICSGAAVVEWFIAYTIATPTKSSTSNMVAIALPGPSVFSKLTTICHVSTKDSRGISISLLLDRVIFLLLAITSFILVVILGVRPPSLPFARGQGYSV